MKNFTNNQRGFTLVQVLVYMLCFIVITVIGFGIISNLVISNATNSGKIKFYTEKNQLYAILDKHMNDLEDLDITDNVLTYKHSGKEIRYEQTDEGLMYYENYGDPDYEIEQTYGTITQTQFNRIDRICTESGGTVNCNEIAGVFEVKLYAERELMGRLMINKSRRGFYHGL